MAVMREGEDRLMPDQFCYSFQGFCEFHGHVPTHEQWNSIKHHHSRNRRAQSYVVGTSPSADMMDHCFPEEIASNPRIKLEQI
jgi:hypothetical protein